MARLGRKWRVMKWAGTLFATLIVVAWGASLRFAYGYSVLTKPGWVCHEFYVERGCLIYDQSTYLEGVSSVGWFAHYRPVVGPGRTSWQMPVLSPFVVVLPLWTVLLIIALPSAVLLWCDCRRVPAHCCHACGYDLTGNLSGVCPECGGQVG